jgi:hypothetical protein
VLPAWTVEPLVGEIGCGAGTGVMTNEETGLVTSHDGVAAQSMW